MKITVSAQAYAKINLHGCKYPHKAVNGLLLGCDTSFGLHVQDAVPLFHQCLGLAPMLEIALAQVRYANSNKQLLIFLLLVVKVFRLAVVCCG